LYLPMVLLPGWLRATGQRIPPRCMPLMSCRDQLNKLRVAKDNSARSQAHD
jgi:hypothetical protein